jgi:hypothetical protein
MKDGTDVLVVTDSDSGDVLAVVNATTMDLLAFEDKVQELHDQYDSVNFILASENTLVTPEEYLQELKEGLKTQSEETEGGE